jgi:hypothetical protein
LRAKKRTTSTTTRLGKADRDSVTDPWLPAMSDTEKRCQGQPPECSRGESNPSVNSTLSGSNLQISNFDFSMTAPTKTDHFVQSVCLLGIIMLSNRNDVVNVWFLSEFLLSCTARLARMIVTLEGLPSYFGPRANVPDMDPTPPHGVPIVLRSLRPPYPEALP